MASGPVSPGCPHPEEHTNGEAWPDGPLCKSRAGRQPGAFAGEGTDPGEEWCALGVLGLGVWPTQM